MSQLHPCPSCARHVKKAEAACPFCGASISLGGVAPRTRPTQRMGRAATFAFGAAVATSVVACSSPAPTPGNDAAGTDAAVVTDTGTSDDGGGSEDAATAVDANIDTGTPVAAYGGPMFDTGSDQDAGADTGAPTTLYGGPGT